MKIEMGKKYQFNTDDESMKGRKFRRVLAIDAEGTYPVVAEFSGGLILTFTAEGLYLTDTDGGDPEEMLIEVKGE